MSNLTATIKLHEGVRYQPYMDSVGKLTIGVGRNLDDKPLTDREVEFLLRNDLDDATEDLMAVLDEDVVLQMGEVRREALINMSFNLGRTRLGKFRKMLKAIRNDDWDEAAKQALDSKWAKQVGIRSEEIAYMLRTNAYPERVLAAIAHPRNQAMA